MQQKTSQLAFHWTGEGEAQATRVEGTETHSSTVEAAALAHTTDLMEVVVSRGNMRRALDKVLSNKGSPGIDGMKVTELEAHLFKCWASIRTSLLAGEYMPSPIRRVDIPKPDGGSRQLGIPTVLDRLIQQALLQVLEPFYDPTFSPHSYGLRPRRSAHQALEAARKTVSEGYEWVVDLDLEKFFDRVNHDMLMGRLARRIGDKRVLRLIRSYLEAGILSDGVVMRRDEGTPQGGPLSPLLANILLDDLDKMLDQRGHRFCRFADDCNIYVRSERAGQRVMASVTTFIERKLKLRVNQAKSAVARPSERKFLGQRIVGSGAETHLEVHPKVIERLKKAVKQITRRKRGVSLCQVLRDLKTLTDGWVAYHRYVRSHWVFSALDGWIRRRLRALIWVQWKTFRNRAWQMFKLGVPRPEAFGIASHSDGPWHQVQTVAVRRALSNKRLTELGYSALVTRFYALAP